MSTDPPDALAGKTVVVADDDDVTRGLLAGVLRKIGLNVLGAARDGTSALVAFHKHRPQIVCLDIEMPGMSGLEVLGKIREENTQVIALIITASPTPDNVQMAIKAGANGVIAKPFSTAKIAADIAKALARPTPNG